MNVKRLVFVFFSIVFFIAGAAVFSAEFEFQFAGFPEGSFYFALDRNLGQVYVMANAGDNQGLWNKYGEPIDKAGKGNFSFYAYCTSDGTAYYALERTTGQLYIMWNVGDKKGKWEKYGGVIDAKAKGKFDLQVFYGSDGSDFLALDKATGQAYSMWNVGDSARVWKKYGGMINK
jgi:hypothetical protein